MILSMTGYGKAVEDSGSRKITVEIKSLNSKQLDLSMRVPSLYRELEAEVRNDLSRMLERGKVDFIATVETSESDCPSALNMSTLAAYKQQIEQAATTLGIDTPSDWFSILMRMPDVISTVSKELHEEDARAFVNAAREAARRLIEFRINEGRKLYSFFKEKIDNIGALLEKVEPYESERIAKIRERLEDQLSRLSSIEYDKGRLEQELIFYIEKLDVTEEKIRLRSHLNYFIETIGAPDDKDLSGSGHGKKLGFIAQEMGREINTLGSKSNNAEMQKIVVMMKDELEQIKEQVLNVL